MSAFKKVVSSPITIAVLLAAGAGFGFGLLSGEEDPTAQERAAPLEGDTQYVDVDQLVVPIHHEDGGVEAFLLIEMSLAAPNSDAAGLLLRHMPRLRHEVLDSFMRLAEAGVFSGGRSADLDKLADVLRADLNKRLQRDLVNGVQFKRLLLQPASRKQA